MLTGLSLTLSKPGKFVCRDSLITSSYGQFSFFCCQYCPHAQKGTMSYIIKLFYTLSGLDFCFNKERGKQFHQINMCALTQRDSNKINMCALTQRDSNNWILFYRNTKVILFL